MLQKKSLRNQYTAGGNQLYSDILANNPEGVKSALRDYYGVVASANAQVLNEEITRLIEIQPQNAAEILTRVLSVPIVQDNLDDVQVEVLVEVIESKQRQSNTPGSYRSTGLGDEDLGMGTPVNVDQSQNQTNSNWNDNSTDGAVSGGGNSFWQNVNWGEVVVTALPGLMNLFGVQLPGGQQQQQQQQQPPAPDRSWIIWVIALIVLAAIAYFAFKGKSNG